MERSEQLEAELELVRLEDELKAAKETEEGPSRELKDRVREARRSYREARGQVTAGEGDAVVQPEAVETTAQAEGA